MRSFIHLKKLVILDTEKIHIKKHLYIKIQKEKNVISIINLKQHQGKELSYNNIVDGDAALSCVINFSKPSCVIVKHANPCGVASSDINLETAYLSAYSTDPVSAFGGVIAFNKEVKYDLIKQILDKQFVEIIIAPKFSEEAIVHSKTKKIFVLLSTKNFLMKLVKI